MSHRIERREDLAVDLAGRYKSIGRDARRDAPEVDADYATLMRDGYVILDGLLGPDTLAELRAGLHPFLDKTGRNNFEGLRTQRVYDVLSKTGCMDRLADHPRILGLLDRLFLPNYLLSQAQVINILPGEAAQLLHCDDAFYRVPRPRGPLGAATIWAIDEFTVDNGATVVIPGSHTWGDERLGGEDEAMPAVMPAGSVLFFLGTTWHGGGANRSSAARLAVTCQYCQPYLRQQESFLLELARERVAAMSPELQSLVGYSIHPPFMGMVDGKHPRRLLERYAPERRHEG
jgi:hypothetical protein